MTSEGTCLHHKWRSVALTPPHVVFLYDRKEEEGSIEMV